MEAYVLVVFLLIPSQVPSAVPLQYVVSRELQSGSQSACEANAAIRKQKLAADYPGRRLGHTCQPQPLKELS